ncbi:hypothetical protein F8M41_006444 [Gigaspora margarita]|uniref:Uncharacterized protein n=1 Tax=Gigaspora margarita TaxID=4874 RepID=A0A8H4A5A1_GIGMA|nr:hypothetical protein F8M41_006444 [Gigaspora margarita]
MDSIKISDFCLVNNSVIFLLVCFFLFSIYFQESPKMAIVNLNCVLLNDNGNYSDDEIFTIEISNDKKYELLKHMVKKRLAPFFDSTPSTKIRLRLSSGANDIKPLIRISDHFPTSPKGDIQIYVAPTPKT